MQIELECKGVEAGDSLVRIPCAEPDEIDRFLVTLHDGAYTAYFRHDLPAHTRERLAALPPAQAFDEPETIRAILAQDALCERMWADKSYVFPPTLPPSLHPDAVRLDDERRCSLSERPDLGGGIAGKTAYAIITRDHIVSLCRSVRENGKSAEAWVVTEPEFRRRGYARQVTAAWARDVQRQGKVPFYSHLTDNRASEALAHSLGLIQFLTTVGYS